MLYHLNERKMYKRRTWNENGSDNKEKKLMKV